MIHARLSLLWLLLHTPSETWSPIWPKTTELSHIIESLRRQIWKDLQTTKRENCIEKTAQRTSNQVRETYTVLLPATVHQTDSFFVFLDPTRSISGIDASLEHDDISTWLKIQVETRTEQQVVGYVVARTTMQEWMWIPFCLTVKPVKPVVPVVPVVVTPPTPPNTRDYRLDAAKRLLHRPFVEEFTSYGLAPQVPHLVYFSNSKFRAGVFDTIFRTLKQSGVHIAPMGQSLYMEWKAHRETVKQWNAFYVPGTLDSLTDLWTLSLPERFLRHLRIGERVSVRCFENELWLYVGFIHKVDTHSIQVSFSGLSFTQTRTFPLLRFHLDARPYYFMGMALTKAALQKWLWESPESRVQLLQGPPGSGKTRTLVREIMYLLQNTDAYVLVLAPTEDAADRITLRFAEEVGLQESILRLPEWNRKPTDMDPKVLAYTVRDGYGYFTVDTTQTRRVWIMTPIVSRIFERLPPHTVNFAHVLVDEATRISEPELLIPLTMTCAKSAQRIILAGDLCQPGPQVYTQHSKYRLKSMFERLWKKHPNVRRRDFTVGYYTPPLLMELANPNHSRTSAFDADFHRIRYPEIYKVEPDAPLVVYGVHGLVEEQTNAQEIELIQRLVCTFDPSTTQLMVISTYEAQNERLRQCLPSTVRVGSIDDLLDVEAEVVVVSLVDETANGTSDWIRFPQSFYALLTRTRGMLMIVGSPMLLQMDPQWRHLLAYAVRNGKYRGVPLDEALSINLPREPTHYEYERTLLPEGILNDE